MNLDLIKAQKYFNIAFKVKNRDDVFGTNPDLVRKFIGQEFNIVSEDVIERHLSDLIMAKFLHASTNGIKANPLLEKEFTKFEYNRKKQGGLS